MSPSGGSVLHPSAQDGTVVQQVLGAGSRATPGWCSPRRGRRPHPPPRPADLPGPGAGPGCGAPSAPRPRPPRERTTRRGRPGPGSITEASATASSCRAQVASGSRRTAVPPTTVSRPCSRHHRHDAPEQGAGVTTAAVGGRSAELELDEVGVVPGRQPGLGERHHLVALDDDPRHLVAVVRCATTRRGSRVTGARRPRPHRLQVEVRQQPDHPGEVRAGRVDGYELVRGGGHGATVVLPGRPSATAFRPRVRCGGLTLRRG